MENLARLQLGQALQQSPVNPESEMMWIVPIGWRFNQKHVVALTVHKVRTSLVLSAVREADRRTHLNHSNNSLVRLALSVFLFYFFCGAPDVKSDSAGQIRIRYGKSYIVFISIPYSP